MPLFKHRFVGTCAAGDQFSYQWYANSIRDIDTAHSAAIVWNEAVWNGATAGNGYKDHVATNVSMQTVITSEINLADGLQNLRRETGQAIPGVMAGNSLPADAAVVVSLRSALPRRTGRGRFYLPQPGAGNLTATGRMSADLVTDLMASLTAAWSAYNTGVDRPVIYSTTFRVTRPLISFNVGDLFDTQRRRENKVPEVRQTATMP